MSENIFVFMLAAAGFLIFCAIIKSRHSIKIIFLNALSGMAALLAVRFVGEIINVDLPLNYFTLIASSLGGTPGVIFLLLLRVICFV